jgi:multiple sugar transport system permease protein
VTLAGMAGYSLLIILAIMCILPLAYCFKVSLEPNANAFKDTTLIPHDLTLANYIEIIQRQDLMVPAWFANSVLVSSTLVAIQLVVVSMAAYAFGRLRFPGRNFLFMAILFTIMVPSQVTMIPSYLIIRSLKLLDSYLGLILPAVGSVFGVFMLRQFLQGLPKELEESALIDGAGQFKTFFAVILPQIKPALIALGILNFLASWNDLFWPLIVMNKLEMRTLSVGLTVLNGSYGQERALVMAGAFIAIIPALVIYAVFQRRIVEGVALSGMGGR